MCTPQWEPSSGRRAWRTAGECSRPALCDLAKQQQCNRHAPSQPLLFPSDALHTHCRYLSGQATTSPCEPQPLRLTAPSGLCRTQFLVATRAVRVPVFPGYCHEHGGTVRKQCLSLAAYRYQAQVVCYALQSYATQPQLGVWETPQNNTCHQPTHPFLLSLPPNTTTPHTQRHHTNPRWLTGCCCSQALKSGGLLCWGAASCSGPGTSTQLSAL